MEAVISQMYEFIEQWTENEMKRYAGAVFACCFVFTAVMALHGYGNPAAPIYALIIGVSLMVAGAAYLVKWRLPSLILCALTYIFISLLLIPQLYTLGEYLVGSDTPYVLPVRTNIILLVSSILNTLVLVPHLRGKRPAFGILLMMVQVLAIASALSGFWSYSKIIAPALVHTGHDSESLSQLFVEGQIDMEKTGT